MIVYRLCRAEFSKDLSGIGAEKFGGRWNSKGVALIYTSENRALCTAEIAVHTPLGVLPQNFRLISIEIPDSVTVSTLKTSDLPKDWKSQPASISTQKIGNKFVKENKSLVLKVPSVIVQGECNLLINPKHKDASKIKIKKIEPFSFDERLFRK